MVVTSGRSGKALMVWSRDRVRRTTTRTSRQRRLAVRDRPHGAGGGEHVVVGVRVGGQGDDQAAGQPETRHRAPPPTLVGFPLATIVTFWSPRRWITATSDSIDEPGLTGQVLDQPLRCRHPDTP